MGHSLRHDICLPKPDTAVSTMLATKREILRWTSSIFDPLGLILLVTITTKVFLQSLWQQILNRLLARKLIVIMS